LGDRDGRMNQQILEARHTHQEIVRKYNLIASVYDLFAKLMASKAQQRALEMAAIQNGERVLEVAFGTGLNFIEILKQNPEGRVAGIDVSTKMLQKTKKRIAKIGHKNHTLHLGDCRHLPFDDETFDVRDDCKGPIPSGISGVPLHSASVLRWSPDNEWFPCP